MRKSGKMKQQQLDTRRWRQRKPGQQAPVEKELEVESESRGGGGRKFFGCYLLTSLSPSHKGHSYIGFTVDPKRRIRQHNGEIPSGAFRTKRKRPWEMVLCIHGFPDNIAALQFEWAWQHPKESKAVREAAAGFKTLRGLGSKIKLALTMLTLPSWQRMNLTVSFFSTTYMKHRVGCPLLPHQMKLHFCSMDELPCYCDPYYPNCCDDEYDIRSYSSNESVDLCDDSEDSPSHSFIPDSIHSQSIALRNSSEHICPLDPQKGASSSMLQAVVPEMLGQNSSTGACGSDSSFDNLFPILEKDLQATHHLAARVHITSQSNVNCHVTRSEETWAKDWKASFPKHTDSIRQADGSPREQIPMIGCVLDDGTITKEDVTCLFIDESPKGPSQTTKRSSFIHSTYTDQPSSTDGVEIIDLCTPSRDCIDAASVTSDCPSVIDLTRSPLFIEM